jgi:hypothetical protein
LVQGDFFALVNSGSLDPENPANDFTPSYWISIIRRQTGCTRGMNRRPEPMAFTGCRASA